MKQKLFVFILGLIVGLLVALVVPPVLEDWLPESMRGDDNTTTGQVVAKRLQEDRLLLTIESENGAVLATFKQKVPEIDLLVDKGDRVTLGITQYEPFVDDPQILSVNKEKAELRDETSDLPGSDEAQGPAGEAGTASAEDAAGDASADEAPPLPPMGPPLEDDEGDQEEEGDPPPVNERQESAGQEVGPPPGVAMDDR